ncbi:hypothetical protein FSPOR_4315 [Fusarium sporotrichioides]|uniref:Uncharacterized protein n=1 Tax=Fusarium sporotrichioides TaxID=5514 RepID=A0A395SC78_FUSSP|nr:hypothetical protein FSPOR_4315 [Fusarium sporotrichioides]
MLVSQLALECYWKLETMTLLHRQARHLSVLQKKYKDQLDVAKNLLDEYRHALFRFRVFLQNAAADPVKLLRFEFPCPPPMRWCYVRGKDDLGRNICRTIERNRDEYTSAQLSLFFILDALSVDEELWTRRFTLVDELERLLETMPEADRLISAHLYQPRARHYRYQNAFDIKREDEPDFAKDYEAALKPARDMVKALGPSLIPWEKVGWFAHPSGGRFKHPFEKPRTKDMVNALLQAEANLDAVWAELDSCIKTNMTQFKFKDLALYRLLSQPRSLRRTAEWVEPEQPKKNGQPSINQDLWYLSRALSNLFLGESEEPTQKVDKTALSKEKTKVKTKGEPSKAQIENAPPVEVAGPEIVDQQSTFPVDARALKVFRTLFSNPEVTSSPGEIAWNDFLHAMASTGFQVEKLSGSVWQFQALALDIERGIHFHEPHPKGKIDFKIARRHGRKLTRTYGWHSGMFVLNGK